MVQYGDTNTAEFTWKDEQSKSHLLNLVENIPRRATAAPALGSGYIYKLICAHIEARAHSHTLTVLSVCRVSTAVCRADIHLASQWWKSRRTQGCGDAGD